MNIYILGGGCFGTQYARWLLTARERGKIAFDRLVVVDKDADCKVTKEVRGQKTEVRIQNSEWVEFLVDHIENAPAETPDLIVPSHAAPHVLGKVFLKLASSFTGRIPQLVDIPYKVGTPFEKRLEKGVVAVSQATWNCPANCPEPSKCPHIRAPRGWDLEMTLRSWAERTKLSEFFVFPARHFAFAVSAIPARTMVEAWRALQATLAKPGEHTVGVATSSACHGILSVFKV